VFTKEIERFTYRNKLDESMGLIGLHVSNSLLFHIVDCKTPKAGCDKLASLFEKSMNFDPYNEKRRCHHWYWMNMHPLKTILPNLGYLRHN
jgi:hypothetical protein